MKVLGFHSGSAVPLHASWRRFIDELPLNHPLGSVILAATGATRAASAQPARERSGDDVVRLRPSPQPTSPQVVHAARIHLSWLSRALSMFPHAVRLLDLRGTAVAAEGAWKREGAEHAGADRQAFDMAMTWDNCAIVTPDDESPGSATTIAAPLHDREGVIVAALVVTADARHLRPEHLLLLGQTAMAIEQHADAASSPRVDISGFIGSMPALPANTRDEARIRRALDLACVHLYVTDAKDRIVYASERAQAEWSRGGESVIGRSLHELFSEATAQAMSANSRKVRHAKTALQFEETVERGSRTRRYLTVRVPFPAFHAAPDAVAAIAIDVTSRQHSHAKAEDYARGMNLLVDAAPSLFSAHTVRHVLRDVAEAARRLVGAERATASVVSDRDVGRLLHATAVSEAGSGTSAATTAREPVVEALIYSVSRPVRQMVDHVVDAGAGTGSGIGARSESAARGWIAVPIAADDDGQAGLIQAWREPGKEFTETDEAVLVQLARLARVAVRNAEAREQAQASERRKDEFLALLGHELRNPLAPMRNATTLLAQPNVGSETVKFARDVIDRQVDQMTRMVNDLLDMSRISSGRLVFQKQPVLLDDIVDRAVEVCAPLFEGKRQVLTISKPDEDLWVDADAGRLAQVLTNLLHNAWKFTPETGEITLQVERRDQEVTVTIADTGEGIPAGMLSSIFGLFVQGERTGAAGPGLGLGLWLARHLVELQGGTIAARSTGPGAGSEFVVAMPLLENPPASQVQEAQFVASARDRSSQGRAVLIVDDNKDSADSIGLLLTAEGCSVRVAYTGAAALEITRTWSPDVVFLDIALPDMTGYAVIRKMREQETTKESAIVAVTGWGRQRDREKTRAAGFDQHLVKPVDPSTIMDVVNESQRGRTHLHS